MENYENQHIACMILRTSSKVLDVCNNRANGYKGKETGPYNLPGNKVEILTGYVGNDPILLLVLASLHLSANKLVKYIKGNTPKNCRWNIKN